MAVKCEFLPFFLASVKRSMVDANTLIIGGSVAVVAIILFLSFSSSKCNCSSEGFRASGSAAFTVARPKYVVGPNHAVKSPARREGFFQATMSPAPNSPRVIKSDAANGGFASHTSLPTLGGLHGAAEYGVSVPSSNTATTVSGNGATSPGSRGVWQTLV